MRARAAVGDLSTSGPWPAGGYTTFSVARDLLRMDLSPAAEESSDNDSMKGEMQAPAALPQMPGFTPDQLRRAKKHRKKYGLALSRPNSPKPKKNYSIRSSKHQILALCSVCLCLNPDFPQIELEKVSMLMPSLRMIARLAILFPSLWEKYSKI